MSLSEQNLDPARGGAPDFVTTHWSVVLAAGRGSPAESVTAMEKLCRAYWYPLYSFVRRQGCDPHQAADLTQEFFSRLIERSALASVDPGKGRFRSFLLISMKNLIATEWNKAHCQKRGGGMTVFSLDGAKAEQRYLLEPADPLTPDKVFERRWAEAVLERALARLREECDTGERARRFEAVKVFLLGEAEETTFAEAAAGLGLSLVAVKGLVHRLRVRFRELIRAEIAHTVASSEEIEEEIRHLFAAFGG